MVFICGFLLKARVTTGSLVGLLRVEIRGHIAGLKGTHAGRRRHHNPRFSRAAPTFSGFANGADEFPSSWLPLSSASAS
jgi:hypothetical protein